MNVNKKEIDKVEQSLDNVHKALSSREAVMGVPGG